MSKLIMLFTSICCAYGSTSNLEILKNGAEKVSTQQVMSMLKMESEFVENILDTHNLALAYSNTKDNEVLVFCVDSCGDYAIVELEK